MPKAPSLLNSTFSTLLPGICYLVVFLLLTFVYPLNKKRVDENAKLLEERRQGNGGNK